jgi:pimeloyl-ACP methyl ester carboxylesterase
MEQRYNIVHWAELPGGGHFAAYEVPELFAAELANVIDRQAIPALRAAGANDQSSI